MSFRRKAGEPASSVLLDEASIEDMIESLTLMADQNVILAKSIVKKVEELANERQRERERRGRDGAPERRGAADPSG